MDWLDLLAVQGTLKSCIKFSLLKEIHPDTDVKNSILDSVGEGKDEMI